MHPALHIDEVLREILVCAADSKKDLVILAQVCRSWKDLALDYTWERLPSFFPLLSLIRNLTSPVTGLSSYNLDAFSSYACRVRRLVHRQMTSPNLDQIQTFLQVAEHNTSPLLPTLTDLNLSFRVWSPIYHALAFSPNLQRLDLDLGFGFQTEECIREPHQFLVNVVTHARDLHKIHIRGTLSPRFCELVPSMQNIRKLSLRSGASLTAKAVFELALLPLLVELDIHAAHLSAEDITTEHGTRAFPSLQKMRLRAFSSTLKAFIAVLPPNKLSWLWLEAQDIVQTDVEWNDILELISTKAATTLHSIGLEHHVEPMQDETITNGLTTNAPDQNSMTPAILPNSAQIASSMHPPLLSLKLFSKFRALKELEMEMTIPPSFSEGDLRELCEGCHGLEILDLGGSSCFEPTTVVTLTKSNLQCLQSLPRLKRLALPGFYVMNPEPSTSQGENSTQCVLRSLILARTSFEDGGSLARHLAILFPSLRTVDGSPKQDDLWSAARNELSRLSQVC